MALRRNLMTLRFPLLFSTVASTSQPSLLSGSHGLRFSTGFLTDSSLRLSRTSRACFHQGTGNVELADDLDEPEELVVGNTKSVGKDDYVEISDPLATQQHKIPPLVRALEVRGKLNVASFQFPGHNRGRAVHPSLSRLIGTRTFLHDFTELDNLFSPCGVLRDAQRQAADLFGAGETWFLVEGTTCGIQAAIMATCSPGDTLILPRNCHISAISGMVLSGARPKYLIPQCDSEWDIPAAITPSQVETAIKESAMEGRKASAVFLASPTYHGICSNLEEICRICHSHGVPIIVDEAHGAHFKFHSGLPRTALQQGADLVTQSTHKVLCSFTQTSMLHMSRDSSLIVDREKICRSLQALQSTSPNSLLLASLDASRALLSENPETIFDEVVELAVEAKNAIDKIPGIPILDYPAFGNSAGGDPLRITIGTWQTGLSSFEANNILSKDYGIASELKGTRSITLAMNLGSNKEDIQKLLAGLKHLSKTYHLPTKSRSTNRDHQEKLHDDHEMQSNEPFEGIEVGLIPREAFFASKKKVAVKESVGKICGELICAYPPGIPLMIPGDVISQKSLSYILQLQHKGAMICGAADPGLSSIVVCNV